MAYIKKLRKILSGSGGQASLLMTFVVMSILIYAGLFLANSSVKQTKTVENLLKSKEAFYASEAGVEGLLYEVYKNGAVIAVGYTFPTPPDPSPQILSNGSTFEVTAITNLRLKSIGSYKNVKRAVEINY